MTLSPVTTTVRSQGTKIRQSCRGSAIHHICSITPTGSALSKPTRTGSDSGSTTVLPPGATALTLDGKDAAGPGESMVQEHVGGADQTPVLGDVNPSPDAKSPARLPKTSKRRFAALHAARGS